MQRLKTTGHEFTRHQMYAVHVQGQIHLQAVYKVVHKQQKVNQNEENRELLRLESLTH
jgi:hypothetical protein